MNRAVGICLTVLLSLVYCATATKVCLLRPSESAKCSARGVHLDVTETESLKSLCEQPGNVVTVRGALVSEQPFNCDQLNTSSFAWISWNDYLSSVRTLEGEKKPLEGNVYLGRNILPEDSSELCRLDLTTGNCVTGSGNQNVLSTEVLIERLPLRYDLKTISVGSWKNVTEEGVVVLATTHLINRQDDTQFVQKVIPFDLHREVHFDLPETLVKDVSVNVYDEAGRLGLRFDVGDAATTLISKSTPAIKRLLGRTMIEVIVKGRTERVLSKLTGDLITVFDRNDDKVVVERFAQHLVLNRIEVGVQEATVEYGVFVKSDGSVKEDDFPSAEDNTPVDPSEPGIPDHSGDGIALFQSPTVYPGFSKISTVAYAIVCTTVVVTLFDVSRQLRKNWRLKKNAYSAVPVIAN